MAKKKTDRNGVPRSFRFYKDDTIDMLKVLSEASGNRSQAAFLEKLIRDTFKKQKRNQTEEFSEALSQFKHLK